jgi:Spy/CpxP family protein refolding chaperone
MKRMIAMILAGMVLTAAAWAHCGNCEGDKAKTAAPAKDAAKCGHEAKKCGHGAKDSCPMSKALEKLNLTDEQKAKIDDLKKQCAAAESKDAAMKMCADGLKKILTEDQFKQWEEGCKAEKGCGGKKACGAKK